MLGYHGLHTGAATALSAVAIGDHVGYGVTTADRCIFIGSFMGVSRNDTLHIGMATSLGGTLPLIYGEFDNTYVKLNAHVEAKDGIKFPSADPRIAGYWWDNAGTLTKSAGP